MPKRYIDVSKHQGDINWSKVKSQVDGVFIRAGYGQNNIDPQFITNIKACNSLGIPCGVYWFSYAYTEAMAKKEAEYCLAAIKPYKVELPVSFDFEDDSVKYAKKQGVTITKTLATKLVHAFCGSIEKAGYYAMNYSNQNYLTNYFDSTTLKYDLWLASWPSKPDLNKPPRPDCGVWQYTDKGSVSGISGNVDMDAAYKDYPTIIQQKGLNNLKKKTEPWYASAQTWVKNKGISDGANPTATATKAEVWSMLYKIYGGK